MADKKITELTELTTPAFEDLLPIVDDPSGTPETKKITLNTLKDNIFIDTRIATKIVAADGSGDYSDIQSAIDSLPAGGGLVFIKDGTYTINSPITITKSNVALVGQGPATILALANGVNDSVIKIGDEVSNITDVIVSDLSIDGNRLNQTAGYGIRILANCDRISILKCIIKSCYNGGVGRLAEATYTRVEDCHFSDCADVVILLMYGAFSIVRGNYIRDVNINSGKGIYLYQDNDSLVEGNIIIGNDGASEPYGIVLYGCYRGVVFSNFIKQVNRGIRLAGVCYQVLVVGNEVWDVQSNGIELGGEDIACENNFVVSPGGAGILLGDQNNLIRGNTVKNAARDSIYGWSGKHVIEGNNICNGQRHGIYLYSCDHCLIRGNRIYNCGQEANDTYSDIYLGGGGTPYASYNLVCDNYILEDGATKTKYGIRENSANDDYNMIWNNRVIGPVTASISIQGANSDASENILG